MSRPEGDIHGDNKLKTEKQRKRQVTYRRHSVSHPEGDIHGDNYMKQKKKENTGKNRGNIISLEGNIALLKRRWPC